MPAPFVSPQPRAPAWEWTQVALLAGNLAWTTLCLGGFRPGTLIVTSALTGALLVVHLLERTVAKGPVPRTHPAGWLMLPFLVYAAVSARWITPVPWLGWRDWLGWAQMIAVFWIVLNGVRSRGPRAALFGILVAIAVMAVVLGAYQVFGQRGWLMMGRTQAPQFVGRASGSFGIPNSLAALLLLLLPATIGLALRRSAGAVARIFWGYVALVLLFGFVLTIARGAWLALAIVLVLWPAFATRGSATRRIAVTAMIAALVATAGFLLYSKVPLVRERFESLVAQSGEPSRPILWRAAWRIFSAKPVVGGGAGSFNVLFDRHRPDTFQDNPRWAHNEYLNTLSDYGAAGFGLFFGACAGIAAWCRRRAKAPPPRRDWLDERLVAQGFVAGLAAFGLQLFVEFHFKIPALALAFAIVAALAVQRAWRVTDRAPVRPGGRMAAGLVALAAAAGSIFFAVPVYRAEALRLDAREAIDRIAEQRLPVEDWPPILDGAKERLRRAVDIDASNGAAWSDLAYATELGSHLAPGKALEIGRAAERAADRALALSRAVPEFWVRRGMALDLQGRWLEAGGQLVEALKLSPASAFVWYQEAFHLSLGVDRSLALGAVAFCLRLDPANHEAQALQRRLAVAVPH
ncbi:MAG TPA: O-antigen ligase family protein [Opitutus sp.]|nr:O-antigen ligase family protein [Opitutus sp.]